MLNRHDRESTKPRVRFAAGRRPLTPVVRVGGFVFAYDALEGL